MRLLEGISVFDNIAGSKKQLYLHLVPSFAHLAYSKTTVSYKDKNTVNEKT